jgi:thiosulfate reductase cytochrome b subunit
MGNVVVWWVRLVCATILIGALASAGAFVLSIGGIGADLGHLLKGVAVWSFYALFLLVAAMLVFSVGNKMSQRFRNWLYRQS